MPSHDKFMHSLSWLPRRMPCWASNIFSPQLTHHMATNLDAKNEGVPRVQALWLHPPSVEVHQLYMLKEITRAEQARGRYTPRRLSKTVQATLIVRYLMVSIKLQIQLNIAILSDRDTGRGVLSKEDRARCEETRFGAS